MFQTLIFNVSELLTQPTGTTQNFSFSGPVVLENIIVGSDISGNLELMRIENGVNAKALKIKLQVEYNCVNCLKKFLRELNFDFAERQFYLEPPKNDDPFDTYLINKKSHTIDLGEMLRQEIILHFLDIPVCSKSCKIGWKDRDLSEDYLRQTHKPLAILKDLIK